MKHDIYFQCLTKDYIIDFDGHYFEVVIVMAVIQKHYQEPSTKNKTDYDLTYGQTNPCLDDLTSTALTGHATQEG